MSPFPLNPFRQLQEALPYLLRLQTALTSQTEQGSAVVGASVVVVISLHVRPFPLNPFLQVQVTFPYVERLHLAFASQIAHGSIVVVVVVVVLVVVVVVVVVEVVVISSQVKPLPINPFRQVHFAIPYLERSHFALTSQDAHGSAVVGGSVGGIVGGSVGGSVGST